MIPPVSVGPTPRDTVLEDGTAKLYRFRRTGPTDPGLPVLLVPSMINRWYVMDLRPGVSLAGALVDAGLDTWLLDWGSPEDEDRYRTWADAVDRIARMVRRTKRETGADRVVLLGYCMGATIGAVYASLYPDDVAGFINLGGPIDFSHAGLLGALVDRAHFDPEEVTAGGNLPAELMQSGFLALRPTGQLTKWVGLLDRGLDPDYRAAFAAIETWANDNISFPVRTYVTYIRELYQENRLMAGGHSVHGRPVNLANIRCPVLTITASRDHICPPASALALNDRVSTDDVETIEVPGGHVGMMVGSRAPKTLYPAIADWIHRHEIRRREAHPQRTDPREAPSHKHRASTALLQ